jgi:hypothetical protein
MRKVRERVGDDVDLVGFHECNFLETNRELYKTAARGSAA